MTVFPLRLLHRIGIACALALGAHLGIPRLSAQTQSAPTLPTLGTVPAQYGQNFAYFLPNSAPPSTFAATGLPPGLTLSTNTGVIDGLPSQIGTFTVGVTVTNPAGSANGSMTITVSQPTAWTVAPAFSGAPGTAPVTKDPAGNTYSFTNSALIKTTAAGVSSTIAMAHVDQLSASITVADFAFTSVAVDASGNIFAAETNNGLGANADPGELILEVSANGAMTTTPVAVAANPNLAAPNCQIAVDTLGDVFTIAPDYSIREVLPSGQILLIAAQSAFNAADGANAYPSGIGVNYGVVATNGSIANTGYDGPIQIFAVGPNLLSFSQLVSGAQLGGQIVGVAAEPGGYVDATVAVNGSPGFTVARISPTGSVATTQVTSATPTTAEPYVQVGNLNAVDAAGNIYSIMTGQVPGASAGGSVVKTTPLGVTTTMLPLTTSTYYPFNGPTPVTLTTGYISVTVDGTGNLYATQAVLSANPSELMVGSIDEPVLPPGYPTLIELNSAGTSSVVLQIDPPFLAMAALNSNVYGFSGGLLSEAPLNAGLTTLGLPGGTYPVQANYPTSLAAGPNGRLYAVANNAIYFASTAAVSAAPQILFQPQAATFVIGGSTTLSVSAAADPSPYPLQYQWMLNGAPIPGATASTYAATVPGVYSVFVSNPSGSVTSVPVQVLETTATNQILTSLPTIVTEPADGSLIFGGSLNLNATAESTLPVTYQWQLDGTNLSGATAPNLTATAPGAYTVIATTSAGSVTSRVASLLLENRLANVSTRAEIGTGAAISIAGFVVVANPGTTKQVLVRAVGPSLSSFGVTGVLAQPVLSVFNAAGGVIASNTGWANSSAVASAAAAAGAFPLMAGSADSALVLTLPAGNYTAQVSGANGTTGIALAEVYELQPDSGHFINISTRAAVGTGTATLIGGMVVSGSVPAHVLVRAAGPALSGYGLSGVLAEPVLSIYDVTGKLMAINTGWSSGDSADAVATASAAKAAGAFAFVPGSADCALLLELPPGAYTAQVTGVDGSTGIALVEAYQVP